MAKIEGYFHGARPLKDGTRTGMISFPDNADKHILADLEGKIILTNEPEPVNKSEEWEVGKKEGVRLAQEAIKEWLEKGL